MNNSSAADKVSGRSSGIHSVYEFEAWLTDRMFVTAAALSFAIGLMPYAVTNSTGSRELVEFICSHWPKMSADFERLSTRNSQFAANFVLANGASVMVLLCHWVALLAALAWFGRKGEPSKRIRTAAAYLNGIVIAVLFGGVGLLDLGLEFDMHKVSHLRDLLFLTPFGLPVWSFCILAAGMSISGMLLASFYHLTKHVTKGKATRL